MSGNLKNPTSKGLRVGTASDSQGKSTRSVKRDSAREASQRSLNQGSGSAKASSSAGVVRYHISPPDDQGLMAKFSPSNLVEIIQAGLDVKELDDLQASLNMPMDRLATKLGISPATLHRRKAKGRLGREESDRVIRFARLMGKAADVFETEDNARKWLASPQVGLGGAVPLDYAETEVGAREVEDLLGRIEFGVYS